MKKKIFISIFLLIFTCAVTMSFYMTGVFAVTTSHMGEGFDYYNTGLWQKADGWSNGNPFNCIWRAGNVNFSGGKMTLAITKDYSGGYAGGEYRSNDTFGYGHYQVNMKPAKNTGIVSSFFTYTGSPWDEIDIEFLGKDTTKVQFNYYTNGQGNHEYIHNLGFDAAYGFHTYAFDWRSDHIAWLVDGREVHRAYNNIPSHPGKIMMNLWPGIGVDDWLDRYNGATPLYAQYDWVSYDP
jgi:beta-glucanase (GH16 family)